MLYPAMIRAILRRLGVLVMAGHYIATHPHVLAGVDTPKLERIHMGLTSKGNPKVAEVVNKAEQRRDSRAAENLRYQASNVKGSARSIAEDTDVDPEFREQQAAALLSTAERLEALAEGLYPLSQVRKDRGYGYEDEQQQDSDPFAPVRY